MGLERFENLGSMDLGFRKRPMGWVVVRILGLD